MPRLKLHPMQKIEIDAQGIVRFRQNKIVRTLLDTGKLDLNDIACMSFPQEDHIQLAQLIGYSISGYGELPYVTDHAYKLASIEARKARRS